MIKERFFQSTLLQTEIEVYKNKTPRGLRRRLSEIEQMIDFGKNLEEICNYLKCKPATLLKLAIKYNLQIKNDVKPGPFIKWVGGKTQLLPEINKLLPPVLTEYYEPFVGGGSVFFHVLNKYPDLERVVISDLNKELMNCYNVIKKYPEELIEVLSLLSASYDLTDRKKDYFLHIRGRYNANLKAIGALEGNLQFIESMVLKAAINQAARFIFLNKTCFNGMYRVNKSGEFNVPFGKHKKPKIFNRDNILSISKALEKVKIIFCDFRNFHITENKNALYYIDPPYDPLNETSDFTSYNKEVFGKHEQGCLEKFSRFEQSKVLISNSDTQFIRDLYSGFAIRSVEAKRSINSKGNKRGKISELLIRNYEL